MPFEESVKSTVKSGAGLGDCQFRFFVPRNPAFLAFFELLLLSILSGVEVEVWGTGGSGADCRLFYFTDYVLSVFIFSAFFLLFPSSSSDSLCLLLGPL